MNKTATDYLFEYIESLVKIGRQDIITDGGIPFNGGLFWPKSTEVGFAIDISRRVVVKMERTYSVDDPAISEATEKEVSDLFSAIVSYVGNYFVVEKTIGFLLETKPQPIL